MKSKVISLSAGSSSASKSLVGGKKGRLHQKTLSSCMVGEGKFGVSFHWFT